MLKIKNNVQINTMKYGSYLILGKLLILIQLLSCKQNTINFDQNID